MKTYINPDKKEWPKILARPLFDVSELFDKVQFILDDILQRGDESLQDFTLKFDGVKLESFEVTGEEINRAAKLVDAGLKEAILQASENIRKFHLMQMPEIKKTETTNGVVCWQKPVPVEKVGLYIPGGSAPLFSTVLMLAIPAQIAGCSEIILCSPPDHSGQIDPAILYAAKISGVSKIFRLGGVQAIGAMAFGTASIPKTDKIFGPGNQYVMAAKQLVSMNDVAIDMPAGPSEVLVVADETANPAFVASDLLSQAEHGPDSQVVLVTGNLSVIEKVMHEIERSSKHYPGKTLHGKRS
jgi:histidinol dehydrogenase